VIGWIFSTVNLATNLTFKIASSIRFRPAHKEA
jgi:hypothetical protein